MNETECVAGPFANAACADDDSKDASNDMLSVMDMLQLSDPCMDSFEQAIHALPLRALRSSLYSTVMCHQPPWKYGCSGVGSIKSGADDKNERYFYMCTSCGSKWNQLRPDKIGVDDNPHIRASNRAVSLSDPTRCDGYGCKLCGCKRNKQRAELLGLPYCKCSKEQRKQATKLPRRQAAYQRYKILPPSRKKMRMYGGGKKKSSYIIRCCICVRLLVAEGGNSILSRIGCTKCSKWACYACAGVSLDAESWLCPVHM